MKHPDQQLLELPQNPFWDVFTRFGRDEVIAGIINVAGTVGLEALLGSSGSTLSPTARKSLLAITGPVIEKIGFFPAHFKEAWQEYRSTPPEHRAPLSHYLKKGLRHGVKSLLEDVLVHDPLYAGMMYAGLSAYPAAPAWMVAGSSFAAAVLAVAGLEVGWNEWQYARFKRSLQRAGFGQESYYEARFLVEREHDADEALEQMARRFQLSVRHTGTYHDRYFSTILPEYSGRTPQLRLRRRLVDKDREVRSAQIVYRRASEIKTGLEQFRYFPSWKEKLYFMLEQEMPLHIAEIKPEAARTILQRAQHGDHYADVQFTRAIVHNPRTLLVSADNVDQARPFYVVEIKVRQDRRLLQEAMRYVMHTLPVLQTTQGKRELTEQEIKQP